MKADTNRNADAVVEANDDQLFFVEPYEISESFSSFLDYVRKDSKATSDERQKRVVKYAQTREYIRRNRLHNRRLIKH